MGKCRFYEGKYSKFCNNQNQNNPECTENSGFYADGRFSGCYRLAMKNQADYKTALRQKLSDLIKKLFL